MPNSRKFAYLAAVLVTFMGAIALLPTSDAVARGGGFSVGASSDVHGNFGGRSRSHISVQGSAHTNGPNALDRDFGVVHARSRMSAQGLRHSKARLHAHSSVDADHDADD